VTAILKQFENADREELTCNLAGWVNRDHEGDYLTVEISPKYEPREPEVRAENRLDFIFRDREE
jgi:hypothetical protein